MLGPLLFLLYTSPVLKIINQHGLDGHCYADDTQIYIHCAPSAAATIAPVLLRCIDDVNKWMSSNRLKLNGDKTEFLWIGSHHALRKVDMSPLIVSGSSLQPATHVRNLGFHLDSELSMTTHVNNLTKTCFLQFRQIRTIRRCVTPSAMK